MTSSDDQDDPSDFVVLSARLRRRVDSAFDSVAAAASSRSETPAGGFVVAESESPFQHEAGGFVVEDVLSESSARPSHIPLSEIPRALKLLGLSPDSDVLGVFQNAAAGWGARNASSDGVSRKDWRAICAALLEGEHDNGSSEENAIADEDIEMDADSDEYQMGDHTEAASSDEYEGPSTAGRGKQVHRAPARTHTKGSGMENARQLTESEKAQCRQEFSRFFPHVLDNELDHQRIMIKDIARVADLLKESLKTEEVLEMLEAFSTSPDKSMNLTDFEHMMVVTKLVWGR